MPCMRPIQLFEGKVSGWQFLPGPCRKRGKSFRIRGAANPGCSRLSGGPAVRRKVTNTGWLTTSRWGERLSSAASLNLSPDGGIITATGPPEGGCMIGRPTGESPPESCSGVASRHGKMNTIRTLRWRNYFPHTGDDLKCCNKPPGTAVIWWHPGRRPAREIFTRRHEQFTRLQIVFQFLAPRRLHRPVGLGVESKNHKKTR